MRSGRFVLSNRELQVVVLASQGRPDKEIAQELGLSIASVNTYWTRIRAKLNINTRSEASAWYGRVSSLVESDPSSPPDSLHAMRDRVSEIMFDLLAEGMLIVSREGKVHDADGTAARILGTPLEELYLSASWHQGAGELLAEDGQLVYQDQLPERRAIEAGETVEGVILGLRTHDGLRRWVLLSARTLVAWTKPEIGLALVKLRDLDARQTFLESVFREWDVARSLFEVAPVALLLVRGDGAIVEANRMAGNMLGAPAELLLTGSLESYRPGLLALFRKRYSLLAQSEGLSSTASWLVDAKTGERDYITAVPVLHHGLTHWFVHLEGRRMVT